jgi:hypothetical protein
MQRSRLICLSLCLILPALLKDLQAAWDRYAEEVGVVPAEQ